MYCFIKTNHTTNGDIMNIDIRKYIISNFKEDSKENIKISITESINSHDEDPLLGLGVFFELLWNNSNQDQQENIINIIEKAIKQNN